MTKRRLRLLVAGDARASDYGATVEFLRAMECDVQDPLREHDITQLLQVKDINQTLFGAECVRSWRIASLGEVLLLQGLHDIDACIALHPLSTSSALTLGWFAGQRKRCCFFAPHRTSILATDNPLLTMVEEVATSYPELWRYLSRVQKGLTK